MINLVGQRIPNLGIASLIKQQEQLNESQPMETDGDSQDVDSHARNNERDIISEDAYGTTDDFTLSTEHDVLDFIGGHPQVDVLDSVTIEDHLYSCENKNPVREIYDVFQPPSQQIRQIYRRSSY
jgi:hypothetical protein